jgi:RNA polymerase sigma factor (sigma-70 family)
MTEDEAFRKYVDELMRFATVLVGPSHAEDVAVEGFMRAFRSPGWPGIQNHRAYLYRVVLNVARSRARGDLRRRRREAGIATGEAAWDQIVDFDVLRAVERLSVMQRAVVMLTYWEDLDGEAVGRRLGVSQGTVKRHLHRAKARLKEYLDE